MIKKLTIDRLKKEEVVLKTEDDREIRLPRDFVPTDKGEGTVLHIAVMAEGKAGEEQAELAKAILNEIISSSDNKEEEED